MVHDWLGGTFLTQNNQSRAQLPPPPLSMGSYTLGHQPSALITPSLGTGQLKKSRSPLPDVKHHPLRSGVGETGSPVPPPMRVRSILRGSRAAVTTLPHHLAYFLLHPHWHHPGPTPPNCEWWPLFRGMLRGTASKKETLIFALQICILHDFKKC